MKKKILWIDDEPGIPLDGQKESPEQILKRTFKGKYALLNARNFREAAAIVQGDKSIELVLLDIHIKPVLSEKQGHYIARELYRKNKNLKFIVMTSYDGDTRSISLGEAGAKIAHIPKKELCIKTDYLLNICSSVLEDFENKAWQFEWDYPKAALRISNKSLRISDDIPFSGFLARFIEYCLESPQKRIDKGELRTALGPDSPSPERLMSDVNKRLLTQTNGRLWGMVVAGITGELLVMAPNKKLPHVTVKKSSAPAAPFSPPARTGDVAHNDLEERVKDCEEKILYLLKMLKSKK